MDTFKSYDLTLKGQKTHVYEGGSPTGMPLIFIHGWPGIAEVFKHQLAHFQNHATPYRLIAPDMRGYGQSSSPADKRAYSMESLVGELIELLSILDISKAVWIGHDWGCAIVAALAAHHPELVTGLVVLAVPYRSLELGLDHLISMVNRDIYPEDKYPYGQWSYMKYYELEPERSVQQLNADIKKVIKSKHIRHKPSLYGKPSGTSRVVEHGGQYGGRLDLVPDIPLSATVLDETLYENLVQSLKKHSFGPPTAYYLNHEVNAAYAKSEKNGGVLDMPVLFVDAKHDLCSTTTTPKMGDVQREACSDFTIEIVDGGHWIMLECAREVNEVLEKWLQTKFSDEI